MWWADVTFWTYARGRLTVEQGQLLERTPMAIHSYEEEGEDIVCSGRMGQAKPGKGECFQFRLFT